MNSDESKHNETFTRNGPRAVPGSQQPPAQKDNQTGSMLPAHSDGPRAVPGSQQPPTQKDIQIGPVLPSRSDALRAEDASRSAGTAEPKNESATKRPSKRGLIAGAIIALV